MTTTYTLNTISQLIQLGTTLSRSWFRGQAVAHNNITPRIFRSEFALQRSVSDNLESTFINLFKREAPVLTKNVPKDDDHISWLFLMQHYGMPTRLLDWSLSPLIAMYFVVSTAQKKDGELWAIHPESLNKKSGDNAIFLSRASIVEYFAEESHCIDKIILAKKFNFEETPQFPIAIYPPVHFQRLAVQLSTFTIHPEPEKGNTIPELLKNEKELVRYIVPAESKHQLFDDLNALCITQRALFPDLDGLSHTIVDYYTRFLAYTPPKPPHWGKS